MTSIAFTKVCYITNKMQIDLISNALLYYVTILYSAQVESAKINKIIGTKYSTTV